MKPYTKNILRIGAGILVLLIIIGAWLYTGSLNETKLSVFSATGAPLGIIDYRLITAGQVKEKMKLSATSGVSAKLSFDQALDAVIRDSKTLAVAQKYDATAKSELINIAYEQAIVDSKQNQSDFEKNLQKEYHLSANDFKNSVLAPLYTEIALRSWYAQSQNLQKTNHDLMESLQTKAQNGENFEDLAKTYSQDEATKQLGGNLGFIPETKLLPELALALSKAEKGNIILAGSRTGLHLIQINNINDDAGTRTYDARQIFLKTTGFNDWINQEQQKIRQHIFIGSR